MPVCELFITGSWCKKFRNREHLKSLCQINIKITTPIVCDNKKPILFMFFLISFFSNSFLLHFPNEFVHDRLETKTCYFFSTGLSITDLYEQWLCEIFYYSWMQQLCVTSDHFPLWKRWVSLPLFMEYLGGVRWKHLWLHRWAANGACIEIYQWTDCVVYSSSFLVMADLPKGRST